VKLSTRAFEHQLERLGVAMIGQTPELAPADQRLYALRDVTGTVESIPLIVASILSKKLAEGVDALVMDVKVGRGAFMKDVAAARDLARALIRVGKMAGKRVVALLTDMDAPLGLSIGNALEAREALEVLHDRGPADVRELTLTLGTEMLVASGHLRGRAAARRRLEAALSSGHALELMSRMVKAQGGDTRCVEHPELLPRARRKAAVIARKSGIINEINPLLLAEISLALGAGRRRVDQAVDHKAGIELCVKRGERIERGDVLCHLHSSRFGKAQALSARAEMAFRIGKAPRPTNLVIERLR
jgi:pyrimidine-nucleoside phosphorylase